MTTTKYHIGCSGWSYADWVGPFYPSGTKPADYLKRYSRVFDCVEIDSSFYRIPNQFMINQWKKNTPEGFLFSPKFPKKITHELKLQNASDTISYFFRTLAGLGAKLGPMVVQLPPSFKYDTGIRDLELFIAELKSGFKYSIEFRHKSWFRDDVYSLLQANNISMCWSINQYVETPRKLTSNFNYVRMVGEDREITKFSAIQKETTEKMAEVASDVKASSGSTDDTFVFFNNHFAGFGPESVSEFRRLLGLMEINYSPSSESNNDSGNNSKSQMSLGDF